MTETEIAEKKVIVETMTEKDAITLIASATNEQAATKWLALDKLIDSLADRQGGITKASVTLGLILKASDMTLDLKDYHKDTVKAVMDGMTEDALRLIGRKVNVIKSCVSRAHNAPAKDKDKDKTDGKDKTDDKDKADGKTESAPFAGQDFASAVKAWIKTLDNGLLSTLKAICLEEETARQAKETAITASAAKVPKGKLSSKVIRRSGLDKPVSIAV